MLHVVLSRLHCTWRLYNPQTMYHFHILPINYDNQLWANVSSVSILCATEFGKFPTEQRTQYWNTHDMYRKTPFRSDIEFHFSTSTNKWISKYTLFYKLLRSPHILAHKTGWWHFIYFRFYSHWRGLYKKRFIMILSIREVQAKAITIKKNMMIW